MTHEERTVQLVRASRRRDLVRVRVGGGSWIIGTVGHVGSRETLILDRRTLRPMRVLIDAIEALEVKS